MVTRIEKTNDDLSNDIKDKTTEAASTLKQKYEQMTGKKETVLDTAEDKLYEIGAKSRKVIDEGEERLRQYCHTIEGQVKTHPMLSIGVAALAGAFLAKIFSSKKH